MSITLLNKRRERLIELNQKHDYVHNEKKSEQYFRLLLEIRKRKCFTWSERRKTDKNYSENLERAKNNIANIFI